MSRDGQLLVVRQFASFTACGAVGTAAHYSALIALVHGLDVGPVPASAVGFTLGALVNYSLNYRLTFRSKRLHRESMPKFFLVALAGLLLNTALMALLTTNLAVHYLVAQIVATGAVLVWNFAANRWWTFR
jgi:putative flippase GtrA